MDHLFPVLSTCPGSSESVKDVWSSLQRATDNELMTEFAARYRPRRQPTSPRTERSLVYSFAGSTFVSKSARRDTCVYDSKRWDSKDPSTRRALSHLAAVRQTTAGTHIPKRSPRVANEPSTSPPITALDIQGQRTKVTVSQWQKAYYPYMSANVIGSTPLFPNCAEDALCASVVAAPATGSRVTPTQSPNPGVLLTCASAAPCAENTRHRISSSASLLSPPVVDAQEVSALRATSPREPGSRAASPCHLFHPRELQQLDVSAPHSLAAPRHFLIHANASTSLTDFRYIAGDASWANASAPLLSLPRDHGKLATQWYDDVSHSSVVRAAQSLSNIQNAPFADCNYHYIVLHEQPRRVPSPDSVHAVSTLSSSARLARVRCLTHDVLSWRTRTPATTMAPPREPQAPASPTVLAHPPKEASSLQKPKSLTPRPSLGAASVPSVSDAQSLNHAPRCATTPKGDTTVVTPPDQNTSPQTDSLLGNTLPTELQTPTYPIALTNKREEATSFRSSTALARQRFFEAQSAPPSTCAHALTRAPGRASTPKSIAPLGTPSREAALQQAGTGLEQTPKDDASVQNSAALALQPFSDATTELASSAARALANAPRCAPTPKNVTPHAFPPRQTVAHRGGSPAPSATRAELRTPQETPALANAPEDESHLRTSAPSASQSFLGPEADLAARDAQALDPAPRSASTPKNATPLATPPHQPASQRGSGSAPSTLWPEPRTQLDSASLEDAPEEEGPLRTSAPWTLQLFLGPQPDLAWRCARALDHAPRGASTPKNITPLATTPRKPASQRSASSVASVTRVEPQTSLEIASLANAPEDEGVLRTSAPLTLLSLLGPKSDLAPRGTQALDHAPCCASTPKNMTPLATPPRPPVSKGGGSPVSSVSVTGPPTQLDSPGLAHAPENEGPLRNAAPLALQSYRNPQPGVAPRGAQTLVHASRSASTPKSMTALATTPREAASQRASSSVSSVSLANPRTPADSPALSNAPGNDGPLRTTAPLTLQSFLGLKSDLAWRGAQDMYHAPHGASTLKNMTPLATTPRKPASQQAGSPVSSVSLANPRTPLDGASLANACEDEGPLQTAAPLTLESFLNPKSEPPLRGAQALEHARCGASTPKHGAPLATAPHQPASQRPGSPVFSVSRAGLQTPQDSASLANASGDAASHLGSLPQVRASFLSESAEVSAGALPPSLAPPCLQAPKNAPPFTASHLQFASPRTKSGDFVRMHQITPEFAQPQSVWSTGPPNASLASIDRAQSPLHSMLPTFSGHDDPRHHVRLMGVQTPATAVASPESVPTRSVRSGGVSPATAPCASSGCNAARDVAALKRTSLMQQHGVVDETRPYTLGDATRARGENSCATEPQEGVVQNEPDGLHIRTKAVAKLSDNGRQSPQRGTLMHGRDASLTDPTLRVSSEHPLLSSLAAPTRMQNTPNVPGTCAAPPRRPTSVADTYAPVPLAVRGLPIQCSIESIPNSSPAASTYHSSPSPGVPFSAPLSPSLCTGSEATATPPAFCPSRPTRWPSELSRVPPIPLGLLRNGASPSQSATPLSYTSSESPASDVACQGKFGEGRNFMRTPRTNEAMRVPHLDDSVVMPPKDGLVTPPVEDSTLLWPGVHDVRSPPAPRVDDGVRTPPDDGTLVLPTTDPVQISLIDSGTSSESVHALAAQPVTHGTTPRSRVSSTSKTEKPAAVPTSITRDRADDWNGIVGGKRGDSISPDSDQDSGAQKHSISTDKSDSHWGGLRAPKVLAGRPSSSRRRSVADQADASPIPRAPYNHCATAPLDLDGADASLRSPHVSEPDVAFFVRRIFRNEYGAAASGVLANDAALVDLREGGTVSLADDESSCSEPATCRSYADSVTAATHT